MYEPKQTIVVRNIPLQSYLRFKAACVMERTPMQKKLTELMEKYVEQRERRERRAEQ